MAKHPIGNRSFDGLLNRFRNNIYQTLKGKTRLAVLQRDFDEFVIGAPKTVLDVGCGEGRWAAELAAKGLATTLVDISPQMIEQARDWFQQQIWWDKYRDRVEWRNESIQSLQQTLNTQQFDIVCCHALLEWLEDPKQGLSILDQMVSKNGWLSILFYNLDGMIYKNLLRGNFKKIRAKDFRGFRGSLTPISPLSIPTVVEQVKQLGYEVVCESGVRVFFDYILDPSERNKMDEREVLEMELQFSRLEPFKRLGRYVHILAKKRA